MGEFKAHSNLELETERLAKIILDSCFVVHKEMGPGLLEKVYQACLCSELKSRQIFFEKEKSFPLFFKGEKLDIEHRVDLIVENRIIMEIKSVERTSDVYHAQLLSYLKLTNLKLGFLVNFNSALMKEGIKRVVL